MDLCETLGWMGMALWCSAKQAVSRRPLNFLVQTLYKGNLESTKALLTASKAYKKSTNIATRSFPLPAYPFI